MTPDHTDTLFVTWRSPVSRLVHPVGRLRYLADERLYEFRYITNARKAVRDHFRPFLEFPEFEQRYLADRLFPMFANRLMPKSRPDRAAFLTALGLSPDTASPMEILARSCGKRETDHVEMFPVPTPSGESRCYRTYCLLRSVRYMPQPSTEERIARLHPGEQLRVMPDPQNPMDANALVVRTDDGLHLGYLPPFLTADLRVLNSECRDLRVFVERVNPPPAEPHHRVLCRVESCWPDGFAPFDSEDFRPVAPAASAPGAA